MSKNLKKMLMGIYYIFRTEIKIFYKMYKIHNTVHFFYFHCYARKFQFFKILISRIYVIFKFKHQEKSFEKYIATTSCEKPKKKKKIYSFFQKISKTADSAWKTRRNCNLLIYPTGTELSKIASLNFLPTL